MSIEGEKVRFALKRFLDSVSPKFGKSCIVKSVSADPLTGLMICDCESIEDGTVIEDVRICANFNDDTNKIGLVCVPKVESIVLVQFIGDSEAYVTMVSEVDFVYLNANTYGGLVKVQDLVTKLNNLENTVNTIITTFNAHTHVASSFGSPTTTPPTPVAGSLTPTVKADLENTTVQHGDGSLV